MWRSISAVSVSWRSSSSTSALSFPPSYFRGFLAISLAASAVLSLPFSPESPGAGITWFELAFAVAAAAVLAGAYSPLSVSRERRSSG